MLNGVVMASKTFHKSKWHDGNYKMIGADENAGWMGMTVFDGARSFNGVQPDLDLHCQRSIKSAQLLMMNPGLIWEEIFDIVKDGINQFDNGSHLYIRITFWDQTLFKGPKTDVCEFSVTMTEIPLDTNGFSANISTHYLKSNPKFAPTEAKASCLYPNNFLAIAQAKKEGFDNCVMLNEYGLVAEFTMSNIFYVKDGDIFTPKLNGTFLNGITRQRVIKLLKNDGYNVYEKDIKPEELDTADEIFSTGNINKVQPINKFKDRELDGSIAKRAWYLYMGFAQS